MPVDPRLLADLGIAVDESMTHSERHAFVRGLVARYEGGSASIT